MELSSWGLWARDNLRKSWYRYVIAAAVAAAHGARGVPGFLLLTEPGGILFFKCLMFHSEVEAQLAKSLAFLMNCRALAG